MDKIRKTVARTFLDLADALETGRYGKKGRIAVTGIGSELGEENVLAGAVRAAKSGIDILYIGTLESSGITTIRSDNESECQKKMEGLLDSGEADAGIAMHYPFPIGVSTVGRVITPAKGKEMFIATTAGTSSTDRVNGMIINALYGIIAAKACGMEKPAVGILNVDGARQAEAALKHLNSLGYNIAFSESGRDDGGILMRGNDVLLGVPDVLVCDSLIGNVIVKMISAFNTGGRYEASGYGYGPGIGRNFKRLVLIVSRVSGASVIANAISYAAELARGNFSCVAEKEFAAADKAGLERIHVISKSGKQLRTADEETMQPKAEPVTAGIEGIEIADIEDAVQALWKNGIYAESCMGCTGPIIRISEKNRSTALEQLKAAGYINQM